MVELNLSPRLFDIDEILELSKVGLAASMSPLLGPWTISITTIERDAHTKIFQQKKSRSPHFFSTLTDFWYLSKFTFSNHRVFGGSNMFFALIHCTALTNEPIFPSINRLILDLIYIIGKKWSRNYIHVVYELSDRTGCMNTPTKSNTRTDTVDSVEYVRLRRKRTPAQPLIHRVG